MTEFDKALMSGGDERIGLLSNGLNKYHINPTITNRVFNRGSCTCNNLTPDVRPSVERLYEKLKTGSLSLQEVRENQAYRIQQLMQDSPEFDVFFAPSGSDLCYYSLMASQLIAPEKPIYNIITCPEELGSGSLLANRGLYFGDETQVKKSVEKGTPLSPHLTVNYIAFPARDAEGGILDHRERIKAAVEKHKGEYSVLVNLVIGSKSGIEDNIAIIDEIDDPDILWVVDVCQLRASTRLIKQLLSKNCLLLTTGSKFYQAPPFCGAMLIPKTISDKMASGKLDRAYGYETIFSKYDIPTRFTHLRKTMPDVQNFGLTLRWESAILEMEKLQNYNEASVIRLTSQWNDTMVNAMAETGVIELMKDQEKTNKSIISFRIKHNGRYLNTDELKALYKGIVTDTHKELDGFDKIIIGQPVSYGENAFIRIALGSYNVRRLVNDDINMENDLTMIKIIERYIKEGRY